VTIRGQGLALVLLVLIAAITLERGMVLWRALRTRRWSRATGQILRSDLVRRHRTFRWGPEIQGADVRYEFTVDGVRREAGVIGYRGMLGTALEDAETLVRKYRPGTKVSVWYDPSQPGRAVLEPGASMVSYVLFAGGAILVILAVTRLVLSA
jgi:hypothetical protein